MREGNERRARRSKWRSVRCRWILWKCRLVSCCVLLASQGVPRGCPRVPELQILSLLSMIILNAYRIHHQSPILSRGVPQMRTM